jgi:hypothetical protein
MSKNDIHPTDSLALQQRPPDRLDINTLPEERPETWGESRSIDPPGGAMVEIKSEISTPPTDTQDLSYLGVNH